MKEYLIKLGLLVGVSILTPIFLSLVLVFVIVIFIFVSFTVILLLPASPIFAYYAERNGLSLSIGDFSILTIEQSKKVTK